MGDEIDLGLRLVDAQQLCNAKLQLRKIPAKSNGVARFGALRRATREVLSSLRFVIWVR